MRIARSVWVGLLLVWFASSSCVAATRHYYIAAEDVAWNYAPSGHNLLNGNPVPPPWSRKLEWDKSRLIEYTDDTFKTPKPPPAWLGIHAHIRECFWHPRICGDPPTPSGHRTSRFCPVRSKLLKNREFVLPAPKSVLGWVFFTYSVKYEDGSSWHPQSEASVLP